MDKDAKALLELDVDTLDALAERVYSLVPQDPAEYEAWLKQPAEAEKCAGQRGFWLRCYTDLDNEYERKYNSLVHELHVEGDKTITEARLIAKKKYHDLFRLVGRARTLSKDFDSRYWQLKDLKLIGG